MCGVGNFTPGTLTGTILDTTSEAGLKKSENTIDLEAQLREILEGQKQLGLLLLFSGRGDARPGGSGLDSFSTFI